MIFLMTPKNMAKKSAFLTLNTDTLCKKMDHDFGIWEKRRFFRRKSAKTVAISDHNNMDQHAFFIFQAKDIEKVLLIFSHDLWHDEINDIVASVRLALRLLPKEWKSTHFLSRIICLHMYRYIRPLPIHMEHTRVQGLCSLLKACSFRYGC
jgi:hypothetical protein